MPLKRRMQEKAMINTNEPWHCRDFRLTRWNTVVKMLGYSCFLIALALLHKGLTLVFQTMLCEILIPSPSKGLWQPALGSAFPPLHPEYCISILIFNVCNEVSKFGNFWSSWTSWRLRHSFCLDFFLELLNTLSKHIKLYEPEFPH